MADIAAPTSAPVASRPLKAFGRRILKDKLALLAALILLIIVGAALFAPWLAPFDPYNTTRRPFIPPIWSEGSLPQHWLGTDGQGRDMLSRLLYGTRLTLVMGLASIIIGGGWARWSPCLASITAGSIPISCAAPTSCSPSLRSCSVWLSRRWSARA
jgi:ABC-type dipeptide/oligopeptide/nickel transport system permease subunit